MRTRHPYLNNLTPLRGIAALWVAVYHLTGAIGNLGLPHLTSLAANGYLMVDLFFIMSGFIIMYAYGESFSPEVKKPALTRFIIARLARLYPLHFFTLLLLVVFRAWRHEWRGLGDPRVIPIHLLLLQSFFQAAPSWNTQSWSISAEWYANLFFPWTARIFYRYKRWTYGLGIPLVIAGYFFVLCCHGASDITKPGLLLRHKLDIHYDFGFVRGFAGFGMGILLYGVYGNKKARLFFSKDVVALACLFITWYCMNKDFSDIVSVMTFPGIILCVAANDGGIQRLCSLRLPQFIGKISYSIYMMQLIVVFFVRSGLEARAQSMGFPFSAEFPLVYRILFQTGYLAILVGISALTYYGIEKPCRNYINRKFMPSSLLTVSAS